jgi:putative tryptophan/tyrosine transport system substrate-binding protein
LTHIAHPRLDLMRRREFIAFFGSAAAAWPLAVRAQQPAKVPTIGFLGASTSSAWNHWVAAFVRRLGELGWIEGRTVAIEYRWAEGRSERYTEIAAEFVRLKVDVIVTVGSAIAAAKQTTSVIPIVFAVAVDPVGTGLVASLARPGGNVTGLSMQSTDLAAKRLELLREVLPGLRRLAIMANVGYPAAVLEQGEVQAAARKLGLDVDTLEIRRPEAIAPAFGTLKSGAQALYVCTESLVNAYHARINTLALGARLPTIYSTARFSKREVSCPMEQTTRTCSGARPTMSTRFCAERSRAKFRSSSRPSSNSASISRPPRHSASRSRRHSCCAPTRSSNRRCGDRSTACRLSLSMPV